MRRTPSLALLVGIVLLALGLLASAVAVGQRRQQDRTMERDAAQVASAFASYFDRARSLDLLLAQNPALQASSVGSDTAAAQRALAYLERLYPGSIGEACLIDQRGRELARITEGVPAAAGDLSSGEATNAFFAATLALDEGEVYQAAPYVSDDTHAWVISNSTWVRQADGQRLVVHFEVALDAFQRYLTASDQRHAAVVDRTTGRTILRDGTALPLADPPGPFRSFASGGSFEAVTSHPATMSLNGRRVAVTGVVVDPANANDWVVVEWSTAGTGFVPLWVGGVATGFGIAIIMLFLIVLRRQQSVLRLAARLDHLTGMGNRKALEESLDAAVLAAQQVGGQPVAVLILDLDGFKQINDTLGHDKGDLVLQEIGRRLHANTLEHDSAARLGGDEFAVVLRKLREPDDVAAVAHRLLEALIRPIVIDGVPRFIGASIGASVHPAHGRSSAELLRAADAAMYQAKRNRDGVRVYDAGTSAGADASGLAAQLLLAIENDDIELAFQPEYALDTGMVVGVEALARWHHDGQAVAPLVFIPLAEQTGLIRLLTLLTLRKALDAALAWSQAGVHVPVSVNLSAQLVSDRSLHADLSDLLAQRGLGGRMLVLEITERTVISDLAGAIDVLTSLRALGVRIELDDFGSGFASFKALHELPLDGVKIDSTLVNDHSPGGERLLAATIDIGHRLGLKVVAEGIEDGRTRDLVRRLGCDTAQGFHLARPMSGGDLTALMLDGSVAGVAGAL